MSSTSRGGKREVSDYYVTPQDQIRDFLRAWRESINYAGTWYVLDPCAGGTEGKVDMSYPAAWSGFMDGMFPRTVIDTMDIRQDSLAKRKCDYLKTKIVTKYDCIISNPPFSLASEFIRKALADVREGGYVVFLLRLNFFGGTTEKPKLWADVGFPTRCYVHAKRMGFMRHQGGKKTDSIEYMHAVWQRGVLATETILKVI